MKTLITTIILVTIAASASFGQLNGRLGKTQSITADWRPGFVNITELTGGIGLGVTDVPYSQSFFGFTNTFSYQFMRRLKAGIGVGVQVHNDGILVPVSLDGRFSFPIGPWAPFIGASGGYAMSPDNFSSQSRIFFNPIIGLRKIQRQNLSFTMAAGMQVQGGGKEARSSFVNVRLGVEFKGKGGKR